MAKTKMTLDELKSQMAVRPTEFVRTGYIPFDMVFEGRGLPLGGLTFIHSPSSAGKTTMLMTICKCLADNGRKTLFAMSEPSPQLAEDMGLLDAPYSDYFSILDIATYNDVYRVFTAFLDSDYSLLIVDSLTACSLSSVMSGELAPDELTPAANARAKQELVKFIQNNLKRHDKAVICVAQQRANFSSGWNAPETKMEGSYADTFYASVILELRGSAQVVDTQGDSKSVVGTQGYLIATPKNRYCSPRVPCYVQILFGKGASNVKALLDYVSWKGIARPAGGTYKIEWNGEELSVRGRSGLVDWVKENAAVLKDDVYANASEYFKALKEGWKPSN